MYNFCEINVKNGVANRPGVNGRIGRFSLKQISMIWKWSHLAWQIKITSTRWWHPGCYKASKPNKENILKLIAAYSPNCIRGKRDRQGTRYFPIVHWPTKAQLEQFQVLNTTSILLGNMPSCGLIYIQAQYFDVQKSLFKMGKLAKISRVDLSKISQWRYVPSFWGITEYRPGF